MLKGTLRLTRLALRRDRVRIPVWILAIAGFTIITAAGFPDIYQDQADRQIRAELIGSPAAKAFAGPGYGLDNYTFGAMLANEMFGFMAIFIALMSILLFVRHTRGEEASGAAELIQANVVGRYALISAALIVVAGTNLLLGVVTAVGLGGLGVEGIGWNGSWLFGVSLAAVGLCFMGIAAVSSQLSEHTRAASGIAGALLALAYTLRAAGDMSGSFLSWLSPIGWAQFTKMYVEDRWWPLLIAVLFTGVCMSAALILSRHRDLAAGYLRTRAGRAFAAKALLSPSGLARRLQRSSFIWWAVGLSAFALLYGTLVSEVERFISEASFAENIIGEAQGAAVIDTFLGTIVSFFALACGVFVLLSTGRLKSEEMSGLSEPIFAASVSRRSWVISHLLAAWLGSAILLFLCGVCLGFSASVSLGDSGVLTKIIGAALVYIPVVWFISGLAVFLFGWKPRLSQIVWVVLIYGLVIGMLGGILNLPEWTNNLSPYSHVPLLPAESLAAWPLAVFSGLAVVLVGLGLTLLNRRDITVS